MAEETCKQGLQVEKVDGLGNPINPTGLYYVQDDRQIIGNCASWWRPGAAGYTCEISEAGVYTGIEVRGMRNSDVPWPVAAVREVVVQHVRHEGLARLRSGEVQVPKRATEVLGA